MAAHGPTRSQTGARSAAKAGAKQEARRRMADHMGEAEAALGAYITAGRDLARLQEAAEQAQVRQREALARLATHVGRAKAASMAEVDERVVRSAQARRNANPAPDEDGEERGAGVSPPAPPEPGETPQPPGADGPYKPGALEEPGAA